MEKNKMLCLLSSSVKSNETVEVVMLATGVSKYIHMQLISTA